MELTQELKNGKHFLARLAGRTSTVEGGFGPIKEFRIERISTSEHYIFLSERNDVLGIGFSSFGWVSINEIYLLEIL